MRIVCKLSGWAAAVACATACTHAPRSEPVYLTMTVQSTQCVLEEIGSGAYTRTVEVMVWNKTVSNLSLMALGTYALWVQPDGWGASQLVSIYF